jgi:hypothetical protein
MSSFCLDGHRDVDNRTIGGCMSDTLETRQGLRPVSSELFNPNWMETLERRRLLSAAGQIVAVPDISLSPLASSASVAGYSPAQIKKAYSLDSITLDGGVKGDGSGQTIAIVDAYNDPNILNDLKTFDKQFSLNDPIFTKVSQTGSTTNLPATDPDWSGEIALDVEWAHAIAPGAKIMLVEAKSAGLNDLLTAVNFARHATGVSVISTSWGTDQSPGRSYDSHFTTPAGHQGVTFVASSGDDGNASWPAISSNVLAVGGTSLTLNSTGGFGNESAWGDSGGGIAFNEPEPSYQLSHGNIGGRGAPDVAYDADPWTGFAVYDSVTDQGQSGWQVFGGTSAGAPQWAAIVAIADQGRKLKGAGTLDGASGTLPAIYSLYNTSDYTNSFHDVIFGGNFFNRAGLNYDYITGLGSPKGQPIINALDSFGLPVQPSKTTTTASTSTAKKAKPTFEFFRPQFLRAPVAQATPAPQISTPGSLFSDVHLPAPQAANVIAAVAGNSGLSNRTGVQANGAVDFGVTGNGGNGSAQGNRTFEKRADSDSSPLVGRVSFDTDTSTLRHLRSADNGETSRLSIPGNLYTPSTYDAAAIAAIGENNNGPIDWNQLVALVGAGVLIGSYAMEKHRQKKAAVSLWPGIDSEK